MDKLDSSEVLKLLLNHLDISANKLSIEIGLKDNTSVYHIKNGRNKISREFAEKINVRFPEVNFSWLLTGEGNMLVNESEIKDLSIENIIKYLHSIPQKDLDNNETWQLFLESQFKSKYIKRVKEDLEKLENEMKIKIKSQK